MSPFLCPCAGECTCHRSPGANPPPCSITGGCGSAKSAEPARCRRADRCADPEKVADELVGAATDGGPLCSADRARVNAALVEAPELYVRLRLGITTSAGTGSSERVTRSKGQPLPLNAGALDLTEQLHWLSTTWADEVITAAARPTVDRASQPEAQQVDDACLLLRTYLPLWIRHQPVELNVTRTQTIEQAGWTAAGLLLDWKTKARRALGLSTLVHRPPEPCPACNVEGVLERRDGAGKVSCTNCGKAWTLEMYETFVHAWVGSGPSKERPTMIGRRGPETAVDGQDARRGSAAHLEVGAR